MYKINDFSKMLGLSPSRIREFESRGLLNVKRDTNGYRCFDYTDAFLVNGFRVYRSLGFSIKDSIDLLRSEETEPFKRSMKENREKLLREQIVLDARIKYIDDYLLVMDKLKENSQCIKTERQSDFLFLPVSREIDFSLSSITGSLIQEWAHYLPVTQFAMLVDLNGEGPPYTPRSFGFAVKAEMAEKLKLSVSEFVEKISLGNCLHFFEKSSDGCSYNLNKLDFVNAFLNEHLITPGVQALIFPFWSSNTEKEKLLFDRIFLTIQ